MSTTEKSPEPIELSIGTLSSATGIPVDTLRTWERRYGFPAPITRTGGSHRRYAAQTIEQLRLIVRALELGHRPSAVVGRDPEELQRLLHTPAHSLWEREAAAHCDPEVLDRWLEHTRVMDGEALLADLQRTLAGMPALQFLVHNLGPYLHALGEAWANGDLRVSQEHLASERVREFLSIQRRNLPGAAQKARATVVLATPPQEQHSLGLHMAAWVVALAGAQIVFLGADVPMVEVAFAVQRHRARGVVLSVAAGYRGNLGHQLGQLAVHLPASVRVAVGGAGSSTTESDKILNGLVPLWEWATQLSREAARPGGFRPKKTRKPAA